MKNGQASAVLGGVFGLESPAESNELVEPPFLGPNVQYFLSARCALAALIAARRPKSAWLPSYLCGAVLTPFVQSGVATHFYDVGNELRASESDWIDAVQPGDLVLVIHYFGFPHSRFPAEQLVNRGALLVEDASQAVFLRQQFPHSACILYSPRKFLGVPDSGVMVSEGETGTESIDLEAPPTAWWKSAVEVSLSRRNFDLTGRSNNWFTKFQYVEAEFPIGLFRASDLSRKLLSAVDWGAMRTRRRANYRKLLELAASYAVLPELTADVVPLGFPVRVDAAMRGAILRRLYAAGIYAPTHWPIADIVPGAFCSAHQLSRSLITLLCDQRATLPDMEWQAREFGAALAGA